MEKLSRKEREKKFKQLLKKLQEEIRDVTKKPKRPLSSAKGKRSARAGSFSLSANRSPSVEEARSLKRPLSSSKFKARLPLSTISKLKQSPVVLRRKRRHHNSVFNTAWANVDIPITSLDSAKRSPWLKKGLRFRRKKVRSLSPLRRYCLHSEKMCGDKCIHANKARMIKYNCTRKTLKMSIAEIEEIPF